MEERKREKKDKRRMTVREGKGYIEIRKEGRKMKGRKEDRS